MAEKDLQELRGIVDNELDNIENLIYELESHYLNETDKTGKHPLNRQPYPRMGKFVQ